MPKAKDEWTLKILSVLTKEPQTSSQIGKQIGMKSDEVRSRLHTNSVKHLIKFDYGKKATTFALKIQPDEYPNNMAHYQPWTTRLDNRSRRAVA